MTRPGLLSSTLACAMFLTSSFAAPVAAFPTHYRVDLVVTDDELGLVGVGNPHSVYLEIESTTPDTNPSPDDFFGTNAGTFDAALPGTGSSSIDSVDARVLSPLGGWLAGGTLAPLVVDPVTWELLIYGLNLTPNQVLPDFDELSTSFVGSFSANDTLFRGDVVGLVLVPEPSTALALGAGLVALARRRGRRTR